MNAKVEVESIVIPPNLVPTFDRLVTDYALAHKEPPSECRRLVEIVVLQRGVRALAEDLKANKEFGERMGWPKTEGSEAT